MAENPGEKQSHTNDKDTQYGTDGDKTENNYGKVKFLAVPILKYISWIKHWTHSCFCRQSKRIKKGLDLQEFSKLEYIENEIEYVVEKLRVHRVPLTSTIIKEDLDELKTYNNKLTSSVSFDNLSKRKKSKRQYIMRDTSESSKYNVEGYSDLTECSTIILVEPHNTNENALANKNNKVIHKIISQDKSQNSSEFFVPDVPTFRSSRNSKLNREAAALQESSSYEDMQSYSSECAFSSKSLYKTDESSQLTYEKSQITQPESSSSIINSNLMTSSGQTNYTSTNITSSSMETDTNYLTHVDALNFANTMKQIQELHRSKWDLKGNSFYPHLTNVYYAFRENIPASNFPPTTLRTPPPFSISLNSDDSAHRSLTVKPAFEDCSIKHSISHERKLNSLTEKSSYVFSTSEEKKEKSSKVLNSVIKLHDNGFKREYLDHKHPKPSRMNRKKYSRNAMAGFCSISPETVSVKEKKWEKVIEKRKDKSNTSKYDKNSGKDMFYFVPMEFNRILNIAKGISHVIPHRNLHRFSPVVLDDVNLLHGKHEEFDIISLAEAFDGKLTTPKSYFDKVLEENSSTDSNIEIPYPPCKETNCKNKRNYPNADCCDLTYGHHWGKQKKPKRSTSISNHISSDFRNFVTFTERSTFKALRGKTQNITHEISKEMTIAKRVPIDVDFMNESSPPRSSQVKKTELLDSSFVQTHPEEEVKDVWKNLQSNRMFQHPMTWQWKVYIKRCKRSNCIENTGKPVRSKC